MMQKSWQITETLAHGYSSDSTRRKLSNEYLDDLVWMIFIIFCILVHWAKVALVLEDLRQDREIKVPEGIFVHVPSSKDFQKWRYTPLNPLRQWEVIAPWCHYITLYLGSKLQVPYILEFALHLRDGEWLNEKLQSSQHLWPTDNPKQAQFTT